MTHRRVEWRRRRASAAVLVAGLVWLAAGAAGAQGSESGGRAGESAPEATAPAEIERRLQAVAAERQAARAALGGAAPAERAALEERLRRLGAIEELLARQQELAAQPEDRGDESADAGVTPPPSVFALQDLYEQASQRERSRGALEEALEASRSALSVAKEALADAERARREARRAAEESGDPQLRTLRRRELESREAREHVHLRTLEKRLAERALERAKAGPELEPQIAAMREALAAGHGDPGPGRSALAAREGALRGQRDALERRLATAELEVEAARRRLAEREGPEQERIERVELLGLRRDALRQELALVDARLERLATERDAFDTWRRALRGDASRQQLDAWESELAEQAAALERAELGERGRSADLRQRLEALDGRLRRLDEGVAEREVMERQHEVLAGLAALHAAEARDLAESRRLAGRVLADVRGETVGIDPLAYAARALRSVGDLWRYEITSVDDEPITTGSLLIALLLATGGLVASQRISRRVGREASERFRLEQGAAAAIQTLTFYVLLLAFTLLALRSVNFPLTAFTVLGGALAIGVGFGSQNVMNNFISGLILLLERPVRSQDVVEVDGNHGTVERIGARSTQIRSVDGRHIIVPNSFFLENNVVNWTLSDDLIRAKVSVGVIYGSPTRQVDRLIRRVVQEEQEALSEPEPIIVFEEFGDNSLNFDVYFWVRARSPMQVRVIQSKVRFRIDDLFREHGLVIAFPQRDVHLDGAGPIEVRMLGGGPRGPEPGSEEE